MIKYLDCLIYAVTAHAVLTLTATLAILLLANWKRGKQ